MSPTPATLMGMDAVKDRSMVAKRANVTDVFVGQKIRTYRTTLGLSQTELAQRLGLTFQQVQKYEKGHKPGWGRTPLRSGGHLRCPRPSTLPRKRQTAPHAALTRSAMYN
jgi:DNA-binding XRE family transcriptional regulator